MSFLPGHLVARFAGLLEPSLARSLSHYAASSSLTSCSATGPLLGSCDIAQSSRPSSWDHEKAGILLPAQNETSSIPQAKAPPTDACNRLERARSMCTESHTFLCQNVQTPISSRGTSHLITAPFSSLRKGISVESCHSGSFQSRSFAAHANLVRTTAVAPAVLGWRPTLEELEREERRRRAQQSGPSHRALLVDAAGTLLEPSEPAAQVYKTLGKKYGVTISEADILQRYRWAYAQPWSESHLRYVDDARLFWASVIEASTGCSDPQYFEDLYQYYASARAWRLIDPHAGEVFLTLREAGVKIAVVSNFDTRLRPILDQLGCGGWFDALAISAEVQAEKPNPTIFHRACELLQVAPEDAVHVGDDRRNDLWGARDAGCDAWLWGYDVSNFADVAARMGVPVADAEEPLVA